MPYDSHRTSKSEGRSWQDYNAVNLAASLAQQGMRVLLVDIDPLGQCRPPLTRSRSRKRNETVYQVLRGELPVAEALRPVPTVPGLDVLPANITLAAAEAELLVAVGRETLLADALENVAGYDYVLIDSPPSLGILTLNALAAADQVPRPSASPLFAPHGLIHSVEFSRPYSYAGEQTATHCWPDCDILQCERVPEP